MKRKLLTSALGLVAIASYAADDQPPPLPETAVDVPPLPEINVPPPLPEADAETSEPPVIPEEAEEPSTEPAVSNDVGKDAADESSPEPAESEDTEDAEKGPAATATSVAIAKDDGADANGAEGDDDAPKQPLTIGDLERLTQLMKENQALQEELERQRGAGINLNPQARVPLNHIKPGPSNEAARKELMQFLLERYAGTNVDVYLQGEYVVVRIPEATYRMGAVKMPLSIRSRLKPIADAAAKFEDKFDLQVEGHSDATPVKKNSAKSNWTVAFARAEAVARELEAMDVPDRSMAVTSRGAGLLADTKDKFSRVNRRVELVFAPKRSVEPIVPKLAASTKTASLPLPGPAKQASASSANGPAIAVSNGNAQPEDIIELPVMVLHQPPDESITPTSPQPVRQ
jgi:Flagellar motor protein